ncbi:hypothetical protein [Methylocella sp.]|jgi:hypothetical protein|uniref:hypothetical protein n=1 Tax=Methylocella sp. TaxID=1978226 RepID=UPI003C1BF11B
MVIFETENLSAFFDEFKVVRDLELETEKATQRAFELFSAKLADPKTSQIDKFIDDQTFRTKNLNVLSKFPLELISSFVSFLNKCIDETWTRAARPGAFEAYNQILIILLDILTSFAVDQFPPALFQTVAYNLNRVSSMVGNEKGTSYAAKRTWDGRKGELTEDIDQGAKGHC